MRQQQQGGAGRGPRARKKPGAWAWALLLVLGGLLASGLVACGGGGGGGGDDVGDLGGPNIVLVDDPAGLLAAHHAALRTRAETVVSAAAAALALTGVTVKIIPDAGQAIPGWGVGGRTFGPTRVEIYLDAGDPALGMLIEQRVAPLVAHELHHAKRWRSVGYGNTLLEAMVSEGLADHFAIQLLAAAVPPWCEAFDRAATAGYLDRARPEFDSTAYSHARWFFDAGVPELPRWTAYTLGYRLVESYLAAHPGATAASLVDASAQGFRP
jgi:Predicted Zn-dependent protease (DUF2268)